MISYIEKFFNSDDNMENHKSIDDMNSMSELDIKRNQMIDTLYFIYTNSCDVPDNPDFPLSEKALCAYIMLYKDDLNLAKKVFMDWKLQLKAKG